MSKIHIARLAQSYPVYKVMNDGSRVLVKDPITSLPLLVEEDSEGLIKHLLGDTSADRDFYDQNYTLFSVEQLREALDITIVREFLISDPAMVSNLYELANCLNSSGGVKVALTTNGNLVNIRAKGNIAIARRAVGCLELYSKEVYIHVAQDGSKEHVSE